MAAVITEKKMNQTFLNIRGGKLRQKVSEENINSELFTWIDKDTGVQKQKYELSFDAWAGTIKSVIFNDTDYGMQCYIELDDATIVLPCSMQRSRHFVDFAKRIKNADITKELLFDPFDFVSAEDKKVQGLAMYEGVKSAETKLTNCYYDVVKKQWDKVLPKPEEDPEHMDKDDWKTFYNGKMRKFYIKQVEKQFKKLNEESEALIKATPEQEKEVSAAVTETFDIKDLPF